MTDTEVSRRERKKEETKERILQSTFQLFRKHGVEATTVEQICDQADIAKGTFFNYFAHKEAVFGCLSESWVAEAEQTLKAIVEQGALTWERVRDAFIAFAAYYEQDRELAKHMALEWTRCMYDSEDAVSRRWDALGVHVVRELQARGQLRRDADPRLVNRILGDVYHDTIVMWLAAPEPPFPLQAELRKRLTLVVEGLARPPKEGQ
jgi:AcrR family transcriptional regulator